MLPTLANLLEGDIPRSNNSVLTRMKLPEGRKLGLASTVANLAIDGRIAPNCPEGQQSLPGTSSLDSALHHHPLWEKEMAEGDHLLQERVPTVDSIQALVLTEAPHPLEGKGKEPEDPLKVSHMAKL